MKHILILLFFFSFSSAWALPECEGSPHRGDDLSKIKHWDNCDGTHTFNNGTKYVGEFKKGLPNEQGTLYYLADNQHKGDKYVGEFKDGNRHGQGTYYYLADNQFKGDKYVGEYKDNKLNGQGTYTWANGDKYVGEFKDGKKNGQGTYIWTNGDQYAGEYKDNKRNGQGTYIWADGHEYVGEFKGDKYNGQGTLFWPDGRVWDGQWKDEEWISGKKYAKGEYKGSVVANNNKNIVEELSGLKDLYNKGIISKETFNKSKNRLLNNGFSNLSNNNRKSEINQESIVRERNKRKRAERELAELKAQKKEEKERISSDTEPPQIIIISSNVQEKQAIIKGKISDNIEVAELTIDGRKVNFSKNDLFEHRVFVPQDGIEVIITATDYSGLTTKKNILLERKYINQERNFNFSKLNPLNINGKKNKKALALIIGISKYNNAPEAKYADRDANYFSDFAESILGIKKNNIKLISNNSANNFAIKKALKIWLKGYSEPNQSDIYIFFAGHGLASTDGKELYLLPYDGEPRLLEDTALLRSEIFETLQSINPKSVTVFLDACYSGQTREKDMILADARPIAIVPVESDVPENFTVFSASSGSEISGSLPEADHGLFSYFLMKGLEGDADANNDKKITNGELHSYVRSNVTRQAIRLGREQTPELKGDLNKVLVEFN